MTSYRLNDINKGQQRGSERGGGYGGGDDTEF